MMPVRQTNGPENAIFDITAQIFSQVFPELVPGRLRRKLSPEQIHERAWSTIWVMARSVLMSREVRDPLLTEEVAAEFINRIFRGNLLRNFDPKQGSLDRYLRGTMRRIALERIRLRSHRRLKNRHYQAILQKPVMDPSSILESKELIERVQKWTAELPAQQRNALARKYTALSNLDNGEPVSNEIMERHKALKHLRALAIQLNKRRHNLLANSRHRPQ